MKGAELSYKLFLFTRSLPLWPSTEHCEPWIVLWLYSTPRIASDKSWDKFWEWDTKSKHGNRLEELLVFWCWTYRKNGQTNIVIFILAGIRGTSFGTLFWKMISSWFTSSSRASRWRKFQKKKNYIAKKEFAYRMCARWPTIAMSKLFLGFERSFCRCRAVMSCALGWCVCDSTCFQVMWLVVRWFVVLLRCYSVLQRTTPVLLCTTKYYSSTTMYYTVRLQYYSVLHSTTPVLLSTTKYYASTTLYYKVLLQ